MACLISPQEPKKIKKLVSGVVSSLPEKFGADFLVVTSRGKVAIQRKRMPEDLISSLNDGRLTRLLADMRQAEYGILLLEGWPSFSEDGHLLHEYLTGYTIKSIRNLLRSIRMTGTWVERSADEYDTALIVKEVEEWFRKPIHRSVHTRPKAGARDAWGRRSERDWARFFLQGLPSVGVVLAESIYDHFGGIPLKWEIDFDDLLEVDGIGKGRAKQIWEAITKDSTS